VRGGVTDAISRMVNDTTVLAVGLTTLLSKALAQIGKGLAAFVMALVFDWRLTLVATVTAPLLYVVIRTISKKIRRASRKALESQADLYRASTEALQALRVVRCTRPRGTRASGSRGSTARASGRWSRRGCTGRLPAR